MLDNGHECTDLVGFHFQIAEDLNRPMDTIFGDNGPFATNFDDGRQLAPSRIMAVVT